MNEKLIKFNELCAKSRHEGLSESKHKEKKELSEDLINEGLMVYNNGSLDFVNEEDSKYFTDTIKNYGRNYHH